MVETIQTNSESEKLRHNCAIFGIVAPTRDVVGLTAFALLHLNHRGQEGSGMSVMGQDGNIYTHKDKGLVSAVYTNNSLADLRSHGSYTAIGQNRYSTSGGLDSWQPFEEEFKIGDRSIKFALVHNGTIANALSLLEELPPEARSDIKSDTDIVRRAIKYAPGETIEEKARYVFERVQGAGNFIIMSENSLIAYRDPWGFRPLSVAKLNGNGDHQNKGLYGSGNGFVVASETCCYLPIKAEFIRDIEPGEMVAIDEKGIRSLSLDSRVGTVNIARCIFELIYIGAPDSLIFGKRVSEVRRAIGEELADLDINEKKLSGSDNEIAFLPDMIIPVQHSGITYAEGYAAKYIESVCKNPDKFGVSKEDLPRVLKSLQTRTGLVSNQYGAVRTFIEPEDRELANQRKHRPDPAVFGKKCVVVDDSIVRSSTAKQIIKMLTEAGASEVHVRVGCPPINNSCYYGVDTPDPNALVWNQVGSVSGVRDKIKATSLKYISHRGLLQAITGQKIPLDIEEQLLYELFNYCGACLTGRYPIDNSGVFVKKSL